MEISLSPHSETTFPLTSPPQPHQQRTAKKLYYDAASSVGTGILIFVQDIF